MSESGKVEIGWRKDLIEAAESNSKEHESSGKVKRLSTGKSTSSDDSDSSNSSTGNSSSSSGCHKDERKKMKKEKHEMKKKHKEEKRMKKEKKKLEKIQRRELKKARKEKRKEEKRLKKAAKKSKHHKGEEDCAIPIDLMYTKAQAPETKEEYEARQKQIRRVFDPTTGRTRLIKGDGEILEEIVSRDQHKEINKQATKGDGDYFQTKTIGFKHS